MFKQLSNYALEEAHKNALRLKLDQDFIKILQKEMENRGLTCQKTSNN
ncbi:Sporulation inhibitor A [Salinibacillus kushneri]|uniref:Sporulation inhibitor A n=1 Tax=Salinibacillus kushneri TaxID=237682 RepID=A0A1I0AUM9_9BACI|nr:sporulation histidine kinase inhibitor Sda [Salinibacillus kushneri]SES97482.1 Sporulation inhibitor A [Salinibacillus kushneri]